MKNLFLAVLGTLFIGATFGQDQEKAKKVLDELSSKTKSYSTMSIDFKLTIKGKDINQTQEGKALVKGDKFYYKTDDREVTSDGKSVWTYMINDEEVYIDAVEDLEGGINPNELMTIWDDNFNYQYVKEFTENGKKFHEIKLFPKDPKNSKYHTVILTIDDAKKQITKIIIKTKDAVMIQFTITKFTPNTDIPDSKFKWVKEKHPGVETIDNR